jgi:two-component system, OmpR family, response regulator
MSYVCLVIAPGGDPYPRADFHHYGIRLQQVNSWAAARALMKQWHFDAMVLFVDTVSPLTLRRIREATAHSVAPLLVVARDADDEAQIRSLDSGAASWLSSPVPSKVVAAKVRGLVGAAERYARKDPRGTLRVGSLSIDRRLAAAQVHGATLDLTAAQFNALAMLAERAGGYVRREELASRCLHMFKLGRGVDMLICRLRRLLRDAGALDVELVTQYGHGYGLVPGALPGPVVHRRSAAEAFTRTVH